MSEKLFRLKMPEARYIYHSSFINTIQKYNVTFKQVETCPDDKIFVNYIFKSNEDAIGFLKESFFIKTIHDILELKALEEIKEKRDVFIGDLI